MTVNFQKALDKELALIESSGVRPRLMLHACCAPCAGYVLEYLSKFFTITVLFYNPNIDTSPEYEKRAAEFDKLLRYDGFSGDICFIDCGWEPRAFIDSAKTLSDEPEGGRRCEVCFRLRLEETAKRAALLGCDYFATTLSVSPHKNAALLNEIGFSLAREHNIKYLVSDFKKRDGYKRSVHLANSLGLYRQNYCGCSYSKH